MINDDQKKFVETRASLYLKALRGKALDFKLALTGNRAQTVVGVYLVWRSSVDQSPPNADTQLQYAQTFLRLSNQYGKQIAENGDVPRPSRLVRKLCEHALRLKPKTWTTYRAAFLHQLLQRRQNSPEHEQADLHDALALLIAVDRPPEVDLRDTKTIGLARAKSLGAKFCEKLVARLADGRPASSKALTFMQVTLLTGLRPSEWANAQFRPAVADDIPDGINSKIWDALVVQTAKATADKPTAVRTLLIHREQHGRVIQEHLANVRAATALDASRRAIDPFQRFIKTSSTRIGQCCNDLWPTQSTRHATLYTFRSQARANFAKWFGDLEASEMLGHDAATGPRYYALKNKGHPTPGILTVRPGRDVVRRVGAAAVARSEQVRTASKPWSAPSEREDSSESPSM